MTALFVGIFICIISALAWAGLDSTRKLLGRSISAVPLVALLMSGQVPLFLLWSSNGSWHFEWAYLGFGILCLGLNITANVLFIRAVQISPLNATIPLLSLTPVSTALIADPLLGERTSSGQYIGILLVIIGALLLNTPGTQLSSIKSLFVAFARERGSVLMLIVAVLFSFTTALDKVSTKIASPAVHGLIQVGGMGLLLSIFLWTQGRIAQLGEVRKKFGLYGLAILLATVAYGGQLIAIQYVNVAMMETIKRTVGLLMALVMGKIIFYESITSLKLVAVLMMCTGSVVVILFRG